MKKFAFLILSFSFLVSTQSVWGQPTKRRSTTSNAAARRGQPAEQKTDRASLMFPVSEDMPEDVVWRRDIYRQLDLTADRNAPLYYPVEPNDRQVNLFTYLFRLFLANRIPVYTYKLDGNESFTEKDRVTDVKEILDRYYIYYEEENGRYKVADNDVPSAQVKRYYVKESNYYDQRTGTYRSKVTALCPVLMDDEGYGDAAAAPKPLFWVKYDDVASYLSRLPLMSSNLNNVINMTADDYFTLNRYEGKIYKTANMQGRVLANETDTVKLRKEQQKIEQQLVDFEKEIWRPAEQKDTLDSTAVAVPQKQAKTVKNRVAEKPATSGEATVKKTTTRRSASATTEKQQKPKTRTTSTPVASARRTRR